MAQVEARKQYNVRRATASDMESAFEIEVSAGSIFKSIPELEDLAGDHASTETFQHWLDTGRIYLAEDNGTPIGYIAAIPKDTAIYIGEISTRADYQGKGVGTTLIEAVFQWAREQAPDKPRVSLTTYREVTWNAPWYRKRGFKEVDATVIGPEHVDKMLYDAEERALMRPGYTRCCMLWEP